MIAHYNINYQSKYLERVLIKKLCVYVEASEIMEEQAPDLPMMTLTDTQPSCYSDDRNQELSEEEHGIEEEEKATSGIATIAGFLTV